MERFSKTKVKNDLKNAKDIKHMAEALHTSVMFHQQPVKMLISNDKNNSYFVQRLNNYSKYKLDQLRSIRQAESWQELARQAMNYLYYASYLITKIEEEKTGQSAEGLFKKTKKLTAIINQESIKYDQKSKK